MGSFSQFNFNLHCTKILAPGLTGSKVGIIEELQIYFVRELSVPKKFKSAPKYVSTTLKQLLREA